jgi:hypothetical protein
MTDERSPEHLTTLAKGISLQKLRNMATEAELLRAEFTA